MTTWDRVFGDRGVLVVPEFPCGMEFGLDCMTFEAGPRFLGVSMLPSGLHFVHYSHKQLPRQGFFFIIDQLQPVTLRPWIGSEEEIHPSDAGSPESLSTLSAAILRGDLNDRLAPYDELQTSSWKNLTCSVSISLLHCLGCSLDSTIDACGEEEFTDAERTILGNYVETSKTQEQTRHVCYTDLTMHWNRFVAGIHRAHPQAEVLMALTRAQADKSEFLSVLLLSRYENSPDMLLGEIQLAFIMFVLLYSHKALQQWKQLLVLVTNCESFLVSRRSFVCNFIQVVFQQLKFIPDDFFDWEISKDMFLLPVFTSLFSSTLAFNDKAQDRAEGDDEVHEHLLRLERYIEKKFSLKIVRNVINSDSSDQIIDCECVFDGVRRDPMDESREDVFQSMKQKISGAMKLGQSDELLSSENELVIINMNEPFASRMEMLHAKYSWRYPLLAAEMKTNTEDILMTAMRILDEYEAVDQTCESFVHLQKCKNEAVHFLENEAATFS